MESDPADLQEGCTNSPDMECSSMPEVEPSDQ